MPLSLFTEHNVDLSRVLPIFVNTDFTWLNKLEEVFIILRNLNYDFRLVGGCVRDSLLGISTKDIDIAIIAEKWTLLQDISSFFTQHKILINGLEHGTVSFTYKGFIVAITLLREDVLTDGRHAVVVFNNDYQLDSNRRDFTFNALYYDVFSRTIYDYHNGLKHLYQKQVHFIGKYQERIQEDYLRILRHMRFTSRFGATSTYAIEKVMPFWYGLKKISSERIYQELDLLLKTIDPYPILAQMAAWQLWFDWAFPAPMSLEGFLEASSADRWFILLHKSDIKNWPSYLPRALYQRIALWQRYADKPFVNVLAYSTNKTLHADYLFFNNTIKNQQLFAKYLTCQVTVSDILSKYPSLSPRDIGTKLAEAKYLYLNS